MRPCRMDLSAYQRRSVRTIEILMGICIALNILLQAILERHTLSTATRYGMALFSITPIVATIIVVARYLRGENDEFLRNLVVEAMLWGLGILLVTDTFFSYLQPAKYAIPFGNISLDIFIVTASIALEIKLWRNR